MVTEVGVYFRSSDEGIRSTSQYGSFLLKPFCTFSLRSKRENLFSFFGQIHWCLLRGTSGTTPPDTKRMLRLSIPKWSLNFLLFWRLPYIYIKNHPEHLLFIPLLTRGGVIRKRRVVKTVKSEVTCRIKGKSSSLARVRSTTTGARWTKTNGRGDHFWQQNQVQREGQPEKGSLPSLIDFFLIGRKSGFGYLW